jgi:pimeloyl-ACP methyl ester carboxylesterase
MKKIERLLFSLISLTVSFVATGQSQQSESSFVTTNDGVSIAYDVNGKGAIALVFVHGWSCDRSYWREQIKTFSKNYKVVTIDLAGHGQSALNRTNWTISSFGNDVASVVKKLKLKRIILIGHSMGGDVIVDAAHHLPDRIIGLIMIDTYKKLGVGREIEQIDAFVKEVRLDFRANVKALVRSLFTSDSDTTLVNFVAEDMASAPEDIALSSIKSSFLHSRQITHDLELLKLPTIAINPDNEETDFESMRLHGVSVVIMKGGGHFIMMEDPKQFNEILDRTIKELLVDNSLPKTKNNNK